MVTDPNNPLSPHLGREERVTTAIALGESHFREFKSAYEGPEGSKVARSARSIRRDISEALCAFANADGGELFLGVEDDGRATGVPHGEKDVQSFLNAPASNIHRDTPLHGLSGIQLLLRGEPIIYFYVEKSTRQVHLTSDGRCLQRRDRATLPVSVEQITFERHEQRSREYDRTYVDGAQVADLDLDLLIRVGDELASGFSAEKVLQLLDLADFGTVPVRLRRAALLLFASDVQRWHPRCQVRLLRVRGTELKAGREYNVTSDETVTGSIFQLITTAWEALRPHLVETKLGPEGVFEERIMYPDDACREALTNAIAHRDYSIEGRGIEIYIFDDHLEIKSPGALLSNVTLADLRRVRGVHESRNAFIARVLREVGYMREMGEGLRRIYSLMKAYDLIEPELSTEQDAFAMALHHHSIFSEDAQRWLDAFDRANLTRDEQKVALLGRNGTPFSPQQIWDALDIVDTDDYRIMVEQLQIKGLLVSE